MTKPSSLKSRLVRMMAVTVLTTGAIAGASFAIAPTIINAAQADTANIKLNQKQAVKKFNQQFKDAKVTEITLEPKGKGYRYQIDGFDKDQEYTASINAKSGKVVWSHSTKRDQDDEFHALDLGKTISRQSATKLAEQTAKNGQAREWKLENDDGQQVWEVDVANGTHTTEVKINALTKDIISDH
ncbi:PepSY domain-containing protein [Limosilactobacillus sp.]|uniref:PepSY domain-containing protein n=1 Tax=Limosilactobacillus sp. TaxID=2773925 RepID=UPI003F08EB18